MNGRIFAGFLILAANQASAAGPEEPPMQIAQQLPVEIVLNQQELAVDVPDRKNAMGASAGLLGFLVGKAINDAAVTHADRRIKEVRDLLVDFPFNEKIDQSLRGKIASEGVSPHPAITTCSVEAATVNAGTIPTGCSDSPQTGVLLLIPHYAVDNDFETLTVSLAAHYIDRASKANGKVKARSRFSHTYNFYFPMDEVEGNGADQNAPRWAALGNERLAKILDEGITQVTGMLVYDFSPEGRAEKEIPKRGSATLKGRDFNGEKVREGENWVWTRSNKHAGSALQGYEPVSWVTFDTKPASTDPSAANSDAAPDSTPPASAMPAMPESYSPDSREPANVQRESATRSASIKVRQI